MRFQDKVVIVTGAGSGIGEATALQFGQEGARVVCMDVRGAEETSEKINKSGGKAVAHIADVSKWPDWERVVEHTINSWGRVDALVAVAGVVSRHIDTVIDQNEAEWDRVININLKGVWFGMKAVLPHMIKNGGGKIVNISSLAAIVGLPGLAAYTSSKGGVSALTRQAAMEYAKDDVQINAIEPGIIETPILEGITPEMRRANVEATPVGRLGDPNEIAYTALFLCSDQADFITGQSFVVDGGWSAH
ncbi:MAG: SDR family oxidoreductase [Firmicutes bacterium]|nr:SDR family oxidoreductase [Bacillota bacterium]